jgi:hypothetical protein
MTKGSAAFIEKTSRKTEPWSVKELRTLWEVGTERMPDLHPDLVHVKSRIVACKRRATGIIIFRRRHASPKTQQETKRLARRPDRARRLCHSLADVLWSTHYCRSRRNRRAARRRRETPPTPATVASGPNESRRARLDDIQVRAVSGHGAPTSARGQPWPGGEDVAQHVGDGAPMRS